MNTGSGGMTKDIGMTADGFADTAAQDAFCSGSVCTFSIIYDQSGQREQAQGRRPRASQRRHVRGHD